MRGEKFTGATVSNKSFKLHIPFLLISILSLNALQLGTVSNEIVIPCCVVIIMIFSLRIKESMVSPANLIQGGYPYDFSASNRIVFAVLVASAMATIAYRHSFIGGALMILQDILLVYLATMDLHISTRTDTRDAGVN